MRSIFIALFLLASTEFCFGEYVILYDKISNEIINIADKESDFQISESDKAKLDVQKMNGSFSDVELEAPVQDYKLVNGKFVLNTKKISDRENAKEVQDEIAQEWAMIQQENINAAIDSLAVKGITLKHFTKK